jgi:hypothetical protein
MAAGESTRPHGLDIEMRKNMHRSEFAEWTLKSVAGPNRGTAIYGDLTELAATRGAAWFWMAYARTLISFAWRMPVAFAAAIASVWIMSQLYPMWVQYQLHHLTSGWHVDMFFGRVALVSSPFLQAIAMCLWFVLPFAWLAFGRQDSMARLAFALCLSTLPVFSYRIWLIDASCAVTLTLLASSLFSSHWRRPFAVLAITSLTVVAAVWTLLRLLAMNGGHAWATYTPPRDLRWLATTCALAIAALVCSRLHRRLLAGHTVAAN